MARAPGARGGSQLSGDGNDRGELAIAIPRRALRQVAAGAVVLVVLVGLAALVWQARVQLGLGGVLAPGIGAQIDRGTYQAVFLVGGQVYFGKLSAQGDDYLLLDDVFYLSDTSASAPQGQLVKRGNELHGPREPMIIPVREVLFIENLRADSQVATAIARFKSGAPGATVAPTTPAPATPAPTVAPSPAPATPSPSPTR